MQAPRAAERFDHMFGKPKAPPPKQPVYDAGFAKRAREATQQAMERKGKGR